MGFEVGKESSAAGHSGIVDMISKFGDKPTVYIRSGHEHPTEHSKLEFTKPVEDGNFYIVGILVAGAAKLPPIK